jgi:hypothetical protein
MGGESKREGARGREKRGGTGVGEGWERGGLDGDGKGA